jgi:hypothetical protein
MLDVKQSAQSFMLIYFVSYNTYLLFGEVPYECVKVKISLLQTMEAHRVARG